MLRRRAFASAASSRPANALAAPGVLSEAASPSTSSARSSSHPAGRCSQSSEAGFTVSSVATVATRALKASSSSSTLRTGASAAFGSFWNRRNGRSPTGDGMGGRCRDPRAATMTAASSPGRSTSFGTSTAPWYRRPLGAPGLIAPLFYEHLFGTVPPVQRSFDDLGTPLAEVTFAVLDLETTGGSPSEDAITEIGAVKVRAGECLSTFHTLVNPGSAIPPAITVLTGITQAMVTPAPRVHAVLPALAEFLGGSVVVGHNVRFDLGFLNAAFGREGWPRLSNPVVDTVALARRLVRDEVPNCRLGTLADRFRLDHRPSHRALDDALATTDLLHLLLERAAAWGVLGLDDLIALPRLAGHPQAAKLRFTVALPRSPGVYWFVDGRGTPLYVGKAANLRQRVRSYFSGDDRRKVGNLLRETVGVRHHVTRSTLEAAVVETRLIHRLQPRYNRQGTRWRSAPYIALTLAEPFPRLKVVKAARPDGSLYLGPLPSAGHAAAVVEAIQTVAPLRRCTERLGPRTTLPLRADPCLAGPARRRAVPVRRAGRRSADIATRSPWWSRA